MMKPVVNVPLAKDLLQKLRARSSVAMNASQERQPGLVIGRGLGLTYASSVAIAVLMAAASGAGLLNGSVLYATGELQRVFLPNDVVNLGIGLPVLLGSMWLARRGRLAGRID